MEHPHYCRLTNYETVFGRLPPLVPRLPSEVMANMSEYKFLKYIQALQTIQDVVFPLLRHIYELPTAKPHCYKPGDVIGVWRCHKKTIGPCWKGPHTVIWLLQLPLRSTKLRWGSTIRISSQLLTEDWTVHTSHGKPSHTTNTQRINALMLLWLS